MTSEQFAYWLQGFVELNGETPTGEQWESIKAHLQTVFKKVTPEIKVAPVIPSPGVQFPGLQESIERMKLDGIQITC